MQVEYEESPADASSAAHPASEGVDVPEGQEGEASDHERDDAGADDQEDQDRSEPAQKKKRVTKSRQSLAEKSKGTTIFPLSRVKRIIRADKELDMMSSEATFLVAVATEYFIKHFMEEGYTKARLERRRIVNYKDMANVVARSDEFDFLADVVPQPMALSEALEKRKQKMAEDDEIESDEDSDDERPKPTEPTERGDGPPGSQSGPSAPARSSSPSKPSLLNDSPEKSPVMASTSPRISLPTAKRPPSSSASSHSRPPASQSQSKPASSRSAQPATPRVSTGKNAPTAPHSLGTRRSLRRSMNAGEESTPVVPPPTVTPPEEAMAVDED